MRSEALRILLGRCARRAAAASAVGAAAILLPAAAMLAGCQPPQAPATGEPAVGEDRKLTVHEAAEALALRVDQTCRSIATLRNSANTVVIYAGPGGEVYVNGKALPDSQGATCDGETMRIPASLVKLIGSALRPAEAVQTPGAEPVEPPLVPPTPDLTRPSGLVVLDPGHGGHDPGAIGPYGSREKDIVLSVARMVAEELGRQGVEARLTRTGDYFVELEERPAIAARAGASLFVSIHADASANRSARGYTVYVSRGPSAASASAGAAIARRLADTGVESRGVKNSDYRVLVHATCPAVLVELGYLTNGGESAMLADRGHQRRLAQALARGIADFLGRKR